MDFISFSPDYWDGPRHNRHYFCQELSKEHKVLFVSPPFYVVKLMRELGKGTLNRSGTKQIDENLLNYAPSKLLFTNLRFQRVNRVIENVRIGRIRGLLRKYGFKNPILLIWHPKFKHMIGKFDESLVIYYAYDQYSGYVGGDPSRPDNTEVELLEKADVVFVLSKKLYEDKKKWASNIVHLPNSVDFELFSKARQSFMKIPDDIARIPKPRIGYIGTINEKVDTNLLHQIAARRPEWSIVLVGRENYKIKSSKEDFERLISRKNVFWLGSKKYDSVPAYIKGLDVCMMCYVINDWTYFGDPSKMHEYLASGKPTVATGLPAIKEFGDVIMIPQSKEGWVKAIERGLNENDPHLVQNRIEVARQNSYPFRIRFAMDVIEKRFAKKRA